METLTAEKYHAILKNLFNGEIKVRDIENYLNAILTHYFALNPYFIQNLKEELDALYSINRHKQNPEIFLQSPARMKPYHSELYNLPFEGNIWNVVSKEIYTWLSGKQGSLEHLPYLEYLLKGEKKRLESGDIGFKVWITIDNETKEDVKMIFGKRIKKLESAISNIKRKQLNPAEIAEEISTPPQTTPKTEVKAPQTTPESNRTKKCITDYFDTLGNGKHKGWEYAFRNEPDYNTFVDLLVDFFLEREYTLPQQINLKLNTKVQIATIMNAIYKKCDKSKVSLKSNSSFLELMKVLDEFAVMDNNAIYKSITR